MNYNDDKVLLGFSYRWFFWRKYIKVDFITALFLAFFGWIIYG